MESDSEAADEPRAGECSWSSDSSVHDSSDVEEITIRLPEELARLHALIPSELLDTTIQGLLMIDEIIKKSLRNGGGLARGRSRCLTEICSKCHQWLCAECLPNCTCEEVCEEPCENVGENSAALHTEETGRTEVDCQVHCGMYSLLFPSST